MACAPATPVSSPNACSRSWAEVRTQLSRLFLLPASGEKVPKANEGLLERALPRMRPPGTCSSLSLGAGNRSRDQRGFTLIEILLALVLLALLMTAAYAGFSASNRAVQRGEAAIDATNKVRVTQQLLRRQIGQALTLAFDQDSGTSTPILIQGSGDELTYVSALPGYLGQGGAYVQRIALESGEGGRGRQLVFRHALLNGFDPTGSEPWAERPVILLEDVDRLAIEYRGLDDAGELGEWSDEWEKPDRLPLLLRIAIEFDDSSNLRWPTLTIPVLLGGDAVVGGATLGPGALTSAPPAPAPKP